MTMAPHGPEAHVPRFLNTSSHHRSRWKFWRTAAYSIVFAFAAATTIACVDTFIGVSKKSEWLDSLGISVGAWSAPALIIAVMAILARVMVLRTTFLRRLLLPPPERVPIHLAAVLVASVGAWVLDFAFGYALLGNTVTQRIALVLVVFVVLVLVVLTYRPVIAAFEWVFDHLPARLRHPGTFIASLILVAVVGLLLGSRNEPDYFREVGWQVPGAMLVVFLVGAFSTAAPKWLHYLMSMVAGLGFGILVWHLTWTHPAKTYRSVQQDLRVTPWLLAVAARLTSVGSMDAPDEVQACRPEERLTPPEQVGTAPDDAPDIILLTIDGWRWDHSSMDPNGTHKVTPQIQAHARRAAVFERAYAPSNSTRQSFRSMFTGIIPGRVGGPPVPRHRWALTLVDGQPTVASYLMASGYETVALVSDPGAFPVSGHGLDGFGEVDDRFVAFRRAHRYVATYDVNAIMTRLTRAPTPGATPRFIWTHLNEPHYPFTYGPELPTADRPPYHERHLHSLRYVDQQVDRLLDYLDGRERKDNTWVFITSDHGEQFDEHGARRHGSSVYEEEIHVPLLVWGPGVHPGRRSTPVSLIDVVPTILEAAGLVVPTGLCGRSLMPSLESGDEPESLPVYAAALPDQTTDWFKVAWIDGDQKLIIDASTGDREMYDLATDPGERRNLLTEDPDLADELVGELKEFYREHGLDPRHYTLEP